MKDMHAHRCPWGVVLFLAAAPFLLIKSAEAQMNWSVEGFFPSYAEFNGPPGCPIFPVPPYDVFFAPVCGGGVCPTLVPHGFPFGGTGVDNNGNALTAFPTVINTDGFHITLTEADVGACLASWPLTPFFPFMTGLDYDSEDDDIWTTDGFVAFEFDVVAACPGPPPLLSVFPLPIAACALGPGLATGIAWDPCTDTVWTCHDDGIVMNCTAAGVFIACFDTGVVPLSGIAVNSTNGNIQVTDGFAVFEFTPAGVLAAPGPFYRSANPYPVPLWGGPVTGLGFSLRPQTYGEGCTPLVGAPEIFVGDTYPYASNTDFEFGQTGAAPGASSALILGFDYICPPLPLPGCATGLWVTPDLIILLGIVPAGGTLSLSADLSTLMIPGCGLPTIYLQFVNFGGPIPPGMVEASNALTFTIGSI